MDFFHPQFLMILHGFLFILLSCMQQKNIKGTSKMLQSLLKIFSLFKMRIWYFKNNVNKMSKMIWRSSASSVMKLLVAN